MRRFIALLVFFVVLLGFTYPPGLPQVPEQARLIGEAVMPCNDDLLVLVTFYDLDGDLSTAELGFWSLTDNFVFAVTFLLKDKLQAVMIYQPPQGIKTYKDKALDKLEHPCTSAKRVVDARTMF